MSRQSGLNARWRKPARAAEPLRRPAPRRPPRTARATQSGASTYLAIPAFVVLYLTVAMLWRVPGWVPALYAGASVLAFLVYAADKSAAKAREWRISESTLLLVGLAGGWPGAIVAQQVLRHKSSKASFRKAFWGTVVLNIAAFLALASPLAARLTA